MSATRDITVVTAIQFRLFGGAELESNVSGVSDDFLARSKQLAFLAYLAIARPNMFYRRDALLILFWPELDTEHARASLRNTLSRLRAALGPDVIETRGVDELRLRPGAVWCDVTEFRAAIERREYTGALDLYRGDLLEGFHVGGAPEFEHWLTAERQALRESAAFAAGDLCSHAASGGDNVGAVSWARRRLQIVADDEDALRDFMCVSAKAGDRAGALRAYDAAARRAADAYGLELSAATMNLAAELKSARDVASPSERRAAAFADSRSPVAAAPAPRRRTNFWTIAGLVILAGVAVGVLAKNPSESDAVAATGTPTWTGVPRLAGPIARAGTALVYDSRSDLGVLFGGRAYETILGDVWRLHDVFGRRRWQRVPTTNLGPGLRWLHAAAYDAAADRMIVFGGSTGYTTPCNNDVWVLPGAMRGAPPLTWLRLATSNAPAPRAEAGVAYDAARNRLIVHGGHDCVGPIYDDLWVLNNANGVGQPEWKRIAVASNGPNPGPRRNHTLVYDPVSDGLILFGGRTGYTSSEESLPSDVWTARRLGERDAQWIRLQPLGDRPRAIEFHRGFHDPSTNRLLILGGKSPPTGRNIEISESWLLIGANGAPAQPVWRRMNLPGAPRVTAFAGTYDADSDAVLIFGGSIGDRATSGLFVLANAMGQ